MHPQCARPDPVGERRLQAEHFAIGGHLQPVPPGLDRGLLHSDEVHLLDLLGPSQENLPGKPQESRPPLRVQHVHGEAPPSERLA